MAEIKPLSITSILMVQDKGRLFNEAQERLAEVVKAVVLTGKAGKISISLTIQPGADETVVISGDVVPKAPKKSAGGSTYYLGEDGTLSREDPRQAEFEVVKEAIENTQ